MGYRVVVAGATGNVGREMLGILAERAFPRTPNADDCTYCAFQPVCGDGVYAHAAALHHALAVAVGRNELGERERGRQPQQSVAQHAGIRDKLRHVVGHATLLVHAVKLSARGLCARKVARLQPSSVVLVFRLGLLVGRRFMRSLGRGEQGLGERRVGVGVGRATHRARQDAEVVAQNVKLVEAGHAWAEAKLDFKYRRKQVDFETSEPPGSIVVDPRKPPAAGPADIWLPLRPATDAAMAPPEGTDSCPGRARVLRTTPKGRPATVVRVEITVSPEAECTQ